MPRGYVSSLASLRAAWKLRALELRVEGACVLMVRVCACPFAGSPALPKHLLLATLRTERERDMG